MDRLNKVYLSERRKPLGEGTPPFAPFPAHVNVETFSFGLPGEKGERAGELVSPPKSWAQVEKESAAGMDLYLRSHRRFGPGVQELRHYASTPPDGFDANRVYGMPTPMDLRGTAVAKSLRWVQDQRKAAALPISSKRVEDLKERTQFQLGLPLDPY